MVIFQIPFDTEQVFRGAEIMFTSGLESAVSDADTGDAKDSDVRSQFYPIMGANISIQAIVEGSLLAEIELDPVPEYGIHF
jgi:hypothetical protein